jgi:chromosomal replication initiation ATPase DnaA
MNSNNLDLAFSTRSNRTVQTSSRSAPERVLLNVAKVYGVKLEEIQKPRSRGNEARDVAIYLLKKEAGLSSKAIDQKLGVILSAIWNRWNDMKRRVAQDRSLAQRIAKCQMLA